MWIVTVLPELDGTQPLSPKSIATQCHECGSQGFARFFGETIDVHN